MALGKGIEAGLKLVNGPLPLATHIQGSERKVFLLGVLYQVGLGRVLAAPGPKKIGEQVVLNATAICSVDVLTDLQPGVSTGKARWSGHESEHEE